jgi:D-apionolactonase
MNLTRRDALKLVVGGALAGSGRSAELMALPHFSPSLQSAAKVASTSADRRGSPLPKAVLYYGKNEPLPERLALRAGDLTMIFEPETTFLRSIRLGEREVIRGIYSAVRDRNWGTVAPQISGLRLETTRDTFQLTFDVTCKEREIDFLWKGTIRGEATGVVRFSMEGTARSTFLRNRLGFCVLHPVEECAGNPCTVETVDGRMQPGVFPKEISPHQPFMNLRAITHDVLPGVSAEVRCEGDVFEMEDHRNWTDASYKTYCTPLALPFPVEVKQGTRVAQSVTLSLKGRPSSASPVTTSGSGEVTIKVGAVASTPLPLIGLGLASRELSSREREQLKRLNLSHLRVDLNLSLPRHKEVLKLAVSEAGSVGLPLEMALHLSDSAEAELQALLEDLKRFQPRLFSALIFHAAEKSTSGKWVQLARRHLTRYDPKVRIGGGTNAYFTELNRERPSVGALDLVCYSINPQVHAFDNLTLVENLVAQGYTADSARQFTGKTPLAVTPVTFKPRFNPNATAAEAARPGDLPSQVDPRQMSLFGAGWTLGSLKYLAEHGVASVTYYEPTGWLGVMESEAGSPLPDKFLSIPSSVFPLYHVLFAAGQYAGGRVIPAASSVPLKVEGLALQKGGRTRILLANLGPDFQPVRLVYPGLPRRVRVKEMDENNAETAMTSPESFAAQSGLLRETSDQNLDLSLRPFALAWIDPAEDAG